MAKKPEIFKEIADKPDDHLINSLTLAIIFHTERYNVSRKVQKGTLPKPTVRQLTPYGGKQAASFWRLGDVREYINQIEDNGEKVI